VSINVGLIVGSWEIIIDLILKGLLNIIKQMIARDEIQAIILGCTELPMLIKSEDLSIHSLNTAEIHINKIIDFMFKGFF
jgi:aspartate/glutamate racemase